MAMNLIDGREKESTGEPLKPGHTVAGNPSVPGPPRYEF
jgi:hypothetical protein